MTMRLMMLSSSCHLAARRQLLAAGDRLRQTAACTAQRFLSTSTGQYQQRQVMSSNSNRRRFQMPQRENPRLRTNAVSIHHSDYSDEDVEAPFEEQQKAAAEEEDPQDRALAALMQGEDEDYKKRKAKWMKKPPPHPTVIDDRGRSYGRGGRKTASARVWIQPGFGEVVVNRRSLVNYFVRESLRDHVLEPLVATRTCGKFDLQCMVQGGGLSGQAGAIRHGLARALNHYNPVAYRPALKKLGHLTRDRRTVERKKVGLRKARKAKQWNRR